MSDFFEFLELEQKEERDAERRALVAAKTRVENTMGDFLRQASSQEEYVARANLVENDMFNIISSACAEYGVSNEDMPGHIEANMQVSILEQYTPATTVAKTASREVESRKPKMCPYHSEVTAISLAQGEPQAGYNAMAQHAWSDKHCQGSDYEGGKCNFKPEMTTQSYWDEKAEKAEERKQQRAEEVAQQQAEQEHLEEIADPVDDSVEVSEEPTDNVVEVDFGGDDSAVGEGVSDAEVPMAMAASFREPRTSEYKYVKQRGDKWVIVQKGTGKVLSTHDSEEKAQAAFRAMEMHKHEGASDDMPADIRRLYEELDAARERGDRKAVIEIEEALANKQAKVAADDGLGGEGSPEPKIDKRLWTPQTVRKIDSDDAKGRWPTKTIDPLVPIVDENRDKLEQIGENVTERQNLPSSDNAGFETKKNVDNGSQGGVFPNRNQTQPVT